MEKKYKKSLILIVDDYPQNLQILGKMLKENGYKTSLSQNGEGALAFVKKKQPDLILLDVMMPEMDGFEVCERLKKSPDTKMIPVIFLTAKSSIENVVKGFDIGGVDYVTKPFNSAELLARVRTQIKLKQAYDEIKTLKGFIPICANCKKIRDDDGFWEQIEEYLGERSEAVFSHSLCPDCTKKLYPDFQTKNK